MEKIKTTLHPKDSPNDELYPNVLPSNIPVDSSLDNTGDSLKVNKDTIQGKLTSGDGISINDDTISVADTINKEKTFNNGIKTNKLTNTNGYETLKDDGSHVVLGNSSRITQILGSASRPSYNGQDIALLTDSDTKLKDLLWANLGIGRWRNQIFFTDYLQVNTIQDNLINQYTDHSYMFAMCGFVNDRDTLLSYNTKNTTTGFIIDPKVVTKCNLMFFNWKNASKLTIKIDGDWSPTNNEETFSMMNVTEIEFSGGYYAPTYSIYRTFALCPNLTTITNLDLSKANKGVLYTGGGPTIFEGLKNLTTIKLADTDINTQINLESSPKLDDDTIDSIINHLCKVTDGSTWIIKLHSDVKAKLSDVQKAKIELQGWTLE